MATMEIHAKHKKYDIVLNIILAKTLQKFELILKGPMSHNLSRL